MKIIAGIVIFILVYLLIGVFVTYLFFQNRSIAVGAAPLVYLGPLIWPVFVISMISSSAEKSAEHARIKNLMSECPAQYKEICSFLYEGDRSKDKREIYSIFLNNIQNNLISDTDINAIKNIAKAVIYPDMVFYADGCEGVMRDAKLLLQDNPSSAQRYIGGYMLGQGINTLLEAEKEINSGDMLLAAQTYEAVVTEQGINTPWAEASAYTVLARYSDDRSRAESYARQAADIYASLALSTDAEKFIKTALYGYILNEERADNINALISQLSSQKGTQDKNVSLAEELPPLIHAGYIGHLESYINKFWDAMDENVRVDVSEKLLPYLFHLDDRSEISEILVFRKLVYERYLLEGSVNESWFTMLFSLLEGYPECATYSLYFEGEIAVLKNDLPKARALFAEYHRLYGDNTDERVVNDAYISYKWKPARWH